MNDKYAEKEKEMREKFPHMFEHPQTREGEVFIDDYAIDVVSVKLALFQVLGLKSVRKGEGALKKVQGAFRDFDITYFPLFANLREFIDAEEKQKAKV